VKMGFAVELWDVEKMVQIEDEPLVVRKDLF
jgi:hypothetical protein